MACGLKNLPFSILSLLWRVWIIDFVNVNEEHYEFLEPQMRNSKTWSFKSFSCKYWRSKAAKNNLKFGGKMEVKFKGPWSCGFTNWNCQLALFFLFMCIFNKMGKTKTQFQWTISVLGHRMWPWETVLFLFCLKYPTYEEYRLFAVPPFISMRLSFLIRVFVCKPWRRKTINCCLVLIGPKAVY